MKKIPFKISVAQLNPTVGDFPGNLQKILCWIDEAEAKGADLVVFPECALCGYPVWDLANHLDFIDAGRSALRRVAAFTRTKKLAVILGFIDKAKSVARGPLPAFNAAAWIEGGKVRTVYHKRLLPTYDVFLEDIFFRAGEKACVVPFRGRKVGLTICEDIWDAAYSIKPLADLKRGGADLVINISASPYYRGVSKRRETLVCAHARKYKFDILYVNQTGGQDELLFDGRSFMADDRGRILFKAPSFEEGLYDFVPRLSKPIPGAGSRGRLGYDEMYRALVMGVRDYFKKNGFTKALVGLSGGIDSALVAAIAADALGSAAVKGVTMPGPYSSEGSWKDSEALAEKLGIEFDVRPIKNMYETFLKSKGQGQGAGNKGAGENLSSEPRIKQRILAGDRLAGRENGQENDLVPSVAMENLQARLRGMELMFLSNDEGRLVLTTGNKSELAMGYCTLYGDMAGGLAVIGDVYKTDVYGLAHYRNSVSPVIPDAILTKAPSAELRPNQTDQDTLPPYEILDEILRLYIENTMSADAIVRKLKKVSSLLVRDVVRKVDHNEYKRRQAPPILRVTEKAWFGRRMPITNRFAV